MQQYSKITAESRFIRQHPDVRSQVMSPWGRFHLLFFLLFFFAVFSVNTSLALFNDRFLEFPIEFLGAALLIFSPSIKGKSPALAWYLIMLLASSFVFGTILSGVRYLMLANLGLVILVYLFKQTKLSCMLFFWTMTITSGILFLLILILANIEGVTPNISHADPFTGSRLSAGYIFSLALWTSLFFIQVKGVRVVAFLGMIIDLIGILLLHARAPLYSLILVLCVASVRYSIRLPLALSLAFLCLYFVSGVIEENYPELLEGVSQRYTNTDLGYDVSFQARVDSWINYLNAATLHPFGIGFDRALEELDSSRESSKLATAVAGAHNEFLKILLEVGWIPFAIFMFVNLSCLITAVRFLLLLPMGLEPLFAGLFMITFIQFMTNNEMQQPEVAIPYWFLLGTMLLLIKHRRSPAGNSQR